MRTQKSYLLTNNPGEIISIGSWTVRRDWTTELQAKIFFSSSPAVKGSSSFKIPPVLRGWSFCSGRSLLLCCTQTRKLSLSGVAVWFHSLRIYKPDFNLAFIYDSNILYILLDRDQYSSLSRSFWILSLKCWLFPHPPNLGVICKFHEFPFYSLI